MAVAPGAAREWLLLRETHSKIAVESNDGGNAVEEVLAKRFRIDRPPTLMARRSSRARIGFSRIRNSHPMHGRSLTVPQEEAFSFHVPLSVPFFATLWTNGRRGEVPELRLGDTQLVDLRCNPVVSLDTPFNSLRFYVPQMALDEMSSTSRMSADCRPATSSVHLSKRPGCRPTDGLPNSASSAPKNYCRTPARRSLILPSSVALSTKATSRGFFPRARVTVRDGGAACIS